MFTGKMTATWLIVITMIGVVIAPLLIIWYTSILPYLATHPRLILGLVDFLPNAQILSLVNVILI
jgi:hypothetical protein